MNPPTLRLQLSFVICHVRAERGVHYDATFYQHVQLGQLFSELSMTLSKAVTWTGIDVSG
jgi:hypothetical protein